MKKSINEELQEALANGAELVAGNKFTAKDGSPLQTRSMESTYDPLEVGDEFTIPVNYQVVKVPFGKDDERTYQCIFIEVHCADGSERNMRWSPNSLCKTVVPIVDGKRQAKVKSSGSAVDLYRTKLTVDESLALLVNRKIRVTASEVYTFRDPQTKELRDTHIYKYDLVLVYFVDT